MKLSGQGACWTGRRSLKTERKDGRCKRSPDGPALGSEFIYTII